MALTPIADVFEQLKQVPQPSKYHPEGNVYVHTALVYAAVRQLDANLSYQLISAAFHDVGKLTTTRVTDEKITAYGHERESLRIFNEYQPFIFPGLTEYDLMTTRYIIINHMKAKRLDEMRPFKVAALEQESFELMKLPGYRFQNPIFKDRSYPRPFTFLQAFVHRDTMLPRHNGIITYFQRMFQSDVNHPMFHDVVIAPFEKFVQSIQAKQNVDAILRASKKV